MRVFVTGGSGDLGKVVTYHLQKRGDLVLRFDVRNPTDSFGQFREGSILDRECLLKNLSDVDCIVHIAAWHGYHEFSRQKNIYDFWDLNVTGTFNVFQAVLDSGIKNIVLISSESVADQSGIYGWTKRISEEIAQRYVDTRQLNVLTLRARAFIPHWNHQVYKTYVDWARWFWKGAVHIGDMRQAVVQAIDLLTKENITQHLILPVDGAYEYTESDLLSWDKEGSGETFKKYYAKFYDTAVKFGLDPTSKPSLQDISVTKKWLGYQPQYSLRNLLEELSEYGEKGPPFKLD